MQQTERKPLFDLGQLVATPGALAALEKSGQSPMDFISRHVTGDWGEIPEEDMKENQFNLEKGFRLLKQLQNQRRRQGVGDHRRKPMPYHDFASR